MDVNRIDYITVLKYLIKRCNCNSIVLSFCNQIESYHPSIKLYLHSKNYHFIHSYCNGCAIYVNELNSLCNWNDLFPFNVNGIGNIYWPNKSLSSLLLSNGISEDSFTKTICDKLFEISSKQRIYLLNDSDEVCTYMLNKHECLENILIEMDLKTKTYI